MAALSVGTEIIHLRRICHGFDLGSHLDAALERDSGYWAGVLIRALEPRDGIPIMQGNRQIERLRDLARGPGRLTAALRVDGRFDGLDPCREGPLWLGRCDHEPGEIGHSIRIGIACDFIFGAVRSSAVQDRLGNKGPYQAVVSGCCHSR